MAARSRHRDPASEHRSSSAPHCRIAGVELQYRFQIGVRSLGALELELIAVEQHSNFERAEPIVANV